MTDRFTIVHSERLTLLELAQLALEFGKFKGRAIGVRDAGPLAVTIERADGLVDVGVNGAIAVALKLRMPLKR